jgi:photosystem II stability/assembly factor-like uncharacterized protein
MRSNKKLFSSGVDSVSRDLVVLALLALLAMQSRPVWAQSNVWTRTGPEGTNLTSVAVDPRNPSTMYATNGGASSSGITQVFKSVDGGASWVAFSTLPVAIQGLPAIDALAIDSKIPSTIYAYGWGGVFKSTDSGQTWVDTLLPAVGVGTYGLGTYFQRGGVVTLAIDSQNSDVVYAGAFVCEGLCGGRVFKSTDGELTWITPKFVFTAPVCSQTISALAVDPQNPSTVYATTTDCNDQGGNLFKSTDGGLNWKRTTLQVFTYYQPANAIEIDPENPNRIYVGTGYGIATSTDSGESWSSTNLPVNSGRAEQFLVTSLVIDRQNPSTLYTAGYSPSASARPLSQIFKSVDGGVSWIPFGDPLSGLYIRSLVVTSGPKTLYAGTSSGVFKIVDTTPVLSLDSAQYCVGGSWKLKVSNGATRTAIRLLGTSNGQSWEVRDWRKTDGDGNWSETGGFAVGMEGKHFLRVEIDGTLSNVVSFVVSNCGDVASIAVYSDHSKR